MVKEKALKDNRDEWLRIMGEIGDRSQKLLRDFASGSSSSGEQSSAADPLNLAPTIIELTARMMANPTAVLQAQFSLWQNYLELWQSTSQRLLGQPVPPLIEPERGDRRFRDPAWDDHAVFDFIKQSYLLTSRWLVHLVNDVDGMDDKTRQKIDFYTRQMIDAMAPNNFVATNPEVLRATLESGGENLLRGLNNLLEDLDRGQGKLRIRMTDEAAFSVGKNVATTPGKVVFQNDLIQLIQYQPTTEKVHKRPLLIIPPWINKFYILDLRPKNSFIRWAVEQGHTVFVISWVNPDTKLTAKTFEDYMTDGPLSALDAIEKATGEKDANVIGYCLGGTLLASTLAYMASKKDQRVKSATFFTTMLDFSDAGELGVFIDEVQLGALEDKMKEKGYLEGADMATTFNMLRANDLIWSFVVNNYLMGKDPFPFDLLYWNSDSTRMPAAMHSFYLRNMYQENKLTQPGGITLKGVKIDLSKVKQPACLISTREDHIAPWKATYAATRLLGGPVKFILAGSGHIAGVVNPPEAEKYGYWTNATNAKDPEGWLNGAEEHKGSWWPEWQRWVAAFDGDKVPARTPGDGKLKVVEDAPGSYVRVQAQD
jgi:polyhydroxyalkanoate synthase